MISVEIGNKKYNAMNYIVVNDGQVFCDGTLADTIEDKDIAFVKSNASSKDLSLFAKAFTFFIDLFKRK